MKQKGRSAGMLSNSISAGVGVSVPSNCTRALTFIVPAWRVERIRMGAEPNSTARGLAPIRSSPMISPSPSTVKTMLSLARRRTFQLSSVTSATTTIKSEPSATSSLSNRSTYRRSLVERRAGIFFSVQTTLPLTIPSTTKFTFSQFFCT